MDFVQPSCYNEASQTKGPILGVMIRMTSFLGESWRPPGCCEVQCWVLLSLCTVVRNYAVSAPAVSEDFMAAAAQSRDVWRRQECFAAGTCSCAGWTGSIASSGNPTYQVPHCNGDSNKDQSFDNLPYGH